MVVAVVLLLPGTVVERDEERLLVSGAVDGVVVLVVVEEALAVEFVLVAAEEDEVVCFSSDLKVSFCWKSDSCVEKRNNKLQLAYIHSPNTVPYPLISHHLCMESRLCLEEITEVSIKNSAKWEGGSI